MAGDFEQADVDHALMQEEKAQQDAEADALADEGGKRRPADAKPKPKDKQRVERDVEHPAGSDAAHGKQRLSLRTQQVVEHKGRTHNRRAVQDVLSIASGVGEDGFGSAQDTHERVQENKTAHREQKPESQRAEKSGGAYFIRFPVFLCAQQA